MINHCKREKILSEERVSAYTTDWYDMFFDIAIKLIYFTISITMDWFNFCRKNRIYFILLYYILFLIIIIVYYY
jgi:hypothetical protein